MVLNSMKEIILNNFLTYMLRQKKNLKFIQPWLWYGFMIICFIPNHLKAHNFFLAKDVLSMFLIYDFIFISNIESL
jgi:hypothetical protein